MGWAGFSIWLLVFAFLFLWLFIYSTFYSTYYCTHDLCFLTSQHLYSTYYFAVKKRDWTISVCSQKIKISFFFIENTQKKYIVCEFKYKDQIVGKLQPKELVGIYFLMRIEHLDFMILEQRIVKSCLFININTINNASKFCLQKHTI